MIKLDKKTFLFLVFIIVFGFFGLAEASQLDWVTGWAWSENIGWISFNCYNYYDGDVTNLVSHCEEDDPVNYKSNYGVDLDYENPSGNQAYLSGYAWSENIGWISFNSDPENNDLAGCPDGTCKAWVNLQNNRLYGWAKALSVDGGWDGWIKLKGEISTGGEYGVEIDDWDHPFQFLYWGWGGDDNEEEAVIGWISANCSNSGVCDDSYYKMITDFTVNLRPEAINPYTSEDDYCCASTPPVFLYWTFLDLDIGDYQTAYQVKLSEISGFPENEATRGCPLDVPPYKVFAGGENPQSCFAQNLSFNTTYYWKVMVWDSKDDESLDYTEVDSFTTGSINPCPNFSCNGQNCEGLLFEEDDFITFINQSINCGADLTSCTYLWEFDFDNGGDTSTDINPPPYSYPSYRDYTVNLTATKGTYTCQKSHTFKVVAPIPKWKEHLPF